jgi:hypothetical protein
MTDGATDQALRRAFAEVPIPAMTAGLDVRLDVQLAAVKRRRRAAGFLLAWTAGTSFLAGLTLATSPGAGFPLFAAAASGLAAVAAVAWASLAASGSARVA